MIQRIEEVTEVLRSHAAEADRSARFPAESMQALREAGLLGLLVPKRHGGQEESLGTFVDIAQRLAGGCLSTAMIWAMHCQQVDILVRHASAELADRVLPAVAAGEVYLASVTTERATGGTLRTAEAPIEEVDDRFSLDRDAPIVTGGAYAEGFLITMRAAVTAERHQVSLVYADRGDLSIEETGRWDALGMRGTHSVGLRLRGQVPRQNLIGDAGQMAVIAGDSMTPMAHLGWSACWLGAARARFSELITWLRTPDRRGGPDVRSDLVRERLGRIRVDLELVHAYLARAVDAVTAQRDSGGSASNALQIQLNSLKLAASGLTFGAVDRMIALAGLSVGYLQDSALPLERAFRDLRSAALNISNERLWGETGTLALMDRNSTLL